MCILTNRFRKFLEAAGISQRIPEAEIFDSHVICSEHFSEDAYEPGELSRVAHSTTQVTRPPQAPRLKPDAMPTLNIARLTTTVYRPPIARTPISHKQPSTSTVPRSITKRGRPRKTDNASSHDSEQQQSLPHTSTKPSSSTIHEHDEAFMETFSTEIPSSIAQDPHDESWRPTEEDYKYVEEDENDEWEEEGNDEEATVSEKNNFSILFVYFSCLLELFNFCSKCGSVVVSKDVKRKGLRVSVTTICLQHHQVIWHSMPRHLHKELGNIIISAGIFLTGLTFSTFRTFAQTIGLAFISRTTFETSVQNYVYPILKQEWYEQRQKLIEETKDQTERVMLAGDGQHDSPGFSAKYCIYTVMNLFNNCIIDFVVVQRGMFTGDLEKNACDVILGRLIVDLENKIYSFLTDRHLGIGKMMREKYPKIVHAFDIWHLAKSFQKKLNPLCTKYPILSEWKNSIINHLWWSSPTCQENSDLLIEKFKSVLYHVRNIHTWRDGELVHGCEHEELNPSETKNRKWLGAKKKKYDTRAEYRALTCALPCEGMVMRSVLAVLDHNSGVSRKVISQVAHYSKASKSFVLKNKYESKSNAWRENILENIKNAVYHPQLLEYNKDIDSVLFPFPIPTRFTDVPKPSMEEMM
ncbi:hypothetical protein B566_EDAN006400, partial [Ephemera danica]